MKKKYYLIASLVSMVLSVIIVELIVVHWSNQLASSLWILLVANMFYTCYNFVKFKKCRK